MPSFLGIKKVIISFRRINKNNETKGDEVMSEELYSYKEFLEQLKKREVPVFTDLIRTLPGILKSVIDENEDTIFYVKGLYNQVEKELYFFSFDKIVQVNILERDVTFKTIKRNIVEATYTPGVHEADQRKLSLVLENGVELNFNSLEDSNKEWNSEYAAILLAIYKSI